MKTRHYYVVEVSHRSNNPVHRTLVRCADEKIGLVEFLDYGEFMIKRVEQLYHFEIIAEIEEMNKEATR